MAFMKQLGERNKRICMFLQKLKEHVLELRDTELTGIEQRLSTTERILRTGHPGAAAADPDRMLTVIPVTRISLSGGEGFLVSNEAADAFIDDRLSHLVLREGERPRVEVLNGNGRTQATRLVAESLVNRGFRVIKTDNADAFTYEES